jgi:cold shock CspA family protein
VSAEGPGGTAARHGRVVAFDAAIGIGRVTSGASDYVFHAAVIADGSRTIEIGAEVTFLPLARFGSWEAADLAPV